MEYNILIVDDSTVTRMVLKKTIGMAEIPVKRIYEASNGREALDLLCGQSVDLILTDLNMPEMNGMEMTAAILGNPKTRHIPVVLITTHASDVRIQELRSQGVKHYIHKPFTPEMIRDALNSLLEIAPA
jgi:two-component system, chemotaxis family, chemotaxis protein CheY